MTVLVDSSVWIDDFRGKATSETDLLETLIGSELIVVGDLALAEVLQGFTSGRDFKVALRLFEYLEVVEITGRDTAILAARNFRRLREIGVTVVKTIDTLIATRCIQGRLLLLSSDRDFDPFVEHLGLKTMLTLT